jgi:transcriptional regulator GlxA family with amidase domain
MPPVNVAIVAVDGFSPFHYSVPCILFGDTVSGEKRFNVTICAEKPGLLTSRDGFALNATQDYSAIVQADIVVVPYWQHVLERPPQRLLDSLVQARDNGAEIVGLCLGSFVLGYAGILDGKRAATHWEFERQFASQFPTCSWISTRSMLMTTTSSRPRAPPPHWIAVCISFASALAAWWRTRLPGG